MVARKRGGIEEERVGVGGGVSDIEETVGGVVRVESETEQALFAIEPGKAGEPDDAQEGSGEQAAVLEYTDLPGLLEDEEAVGAIARVSDKCGNAEPADDRNETDGGWKGGSADGRCAAWKR